MFPNLNLGMCVDLSLWLLAVCFGEKIRLYCDVHGLMLLEHVASLAKDYLISYFLDFSDADINIIA